MHEIQIRIQILNQFDYKMKYKNRSIRFLTDMTLKKNTRDYLFQIKQPRQRSTIVSNTYSIQLLRIRNSLSREPCT